MDTQGAAYHYEEALHLFGEQEDYRWSRSYILYEFAEFWNEAGDPAKGLEYCRMALDSADVRDGVGIHEPETRIYRIAGDAYWQQGRPAEAWATYQLSFWEVYCYQHDYQGEPQLPDAYTVKFYKDRTYAVDAHGSIPPRS